MMMVQTDTYYKDDSKFEHYAVLLMLLLFFNARGYFPKIQYSLPHANEKTLLFSKTLRITF